MDQINTDGERLFKAATKGDLVLIEQLIGLNEDVNQRDKLGKTPLHKAAVKGHSNVVKGLIALGAKVDKADKEGGTPLTWAAAKGHLNVVSILLELGANANQKDRGGKTSINWAAGKGWFHVVEALISSGADVNAGDRYGRSPLHSAADSGYFDIVNVLIAADADVHQVNNDGKTPLYLAITCGHCKVVNILLSAGSNIHHVDENSQNPLTVAIRNRPRSKDIIKHLIFSGSNVSSADMDIVFNSEDRAFQPGLGGLIKKWVIDYFFFHYLKPILKDIMACQQSYGFRSPVTTLPNELQDKIFLYLVSDRCPWLSEGDFFNLIQQVREGVRRELIEDKAIKAKRIKAKRIKAKRVSQSESDLSGIKKPFLQLGACLLKSEQEAPAQEELSQESLEKKKMAASIK